MSYDLFFECMPGQPRPSRAALLAYFEQRPNYQVSGDQAIYENKDTGAYFILDYDESVAEELENASRLPVVADINYLRPHFFAWEGGIELAAFVRHFGLLAWSPQSERTVHLKPDDVYQDWWASSERTTLKLLRSGEVPMPRYALPTPLLDRIWRWNYGLQALQERLGESIFVPRISMLDIEGSPRSMVVWSDAIPIALPAVDYVVLYRKETQPRRLFGRRKDHDLVLKPYHECEPLIISFGTANEVPPCRLLRYVDPPASVITLFRKGKALEGKLRGIRFEEVLNEELVPQGDSLPPERAAPPDPRR
ncbi:MAG: hypothetical protein JW889_03585 [Verrucomicrobia bacterium]|nr:hypothetical protein [Verrucomicrobiota bacterium]